MPPHYTEVLIVGAGPAGTSAAYELATHGISVILLEKSGFPRYKTCGGGLTPKILKELPYDISPVIESEIRFIRFSHQFNDVFTRHSADPLMFCGMRSNMDAFLLERAIQAGAVGLTNEKVLEIRKDTSGSVVVTANGEYHTRILIGADGASGIVARTFDLRSHIARGLAWESEIKTGDGFLDTFGDTVFLDWGTLPGGYGWAFPKKDHVSLGVGGPASLAGMMIPYYKRFYAHVFNSGSPVQSSQSNIPQGLPETLSLKSWPIPVRTKKSTFHRGNVMVTGDAAGLSDPLTGEGIYYAIRSGKLAAQSCIDFLSGKTGNLDEYSDRINGELMTELLEANNVKHVFNAFPGKIHRFVRDSDRAWRAFGKVLKGERSYLDVRNGFGKWKYFWTVVCRITGGVERLKEWRCSGRRKKDPSW
jgi:geranylgeranyl reductase family protein